MARTSTQKIVTTIIAIGSILLIPRFALSVSNVSHISQILNSTTAHDYWQSRDMLTRGYFTPELKWPDLPIAATLDLTSIQFEELFQYHANDISSIDVLLNEESTNMLRQKLSESISLNTVSKLELRESNAIIGIFDQHTAMQVNGIFNYENRENMYWVTITTAEEV